MAWRDDLQGGGIATFRGVPFQITSASSRHGRRTVDHQYPKRDRPYVEDLGRMARPWTLVGFVVGDDYLTQLDAVIAAAEQEGPGTLVHPYRGNLRVACEEVSIEESTDEGRIARLTWTFKEAGDLTFPTATQETAEAARLQAQTTEVAAVAELVGAWGVAGEPGFVVDAAAVSLTGIVTNLRAAVDPLFDLVDAFADFTDLVSEFEDDILILVNTPQAIGDRLRVIAATIGNLDALRILTASAGTQGPLDATTAAALAEQTNTEAALRIQVQIMLAASVTTLTLAAFVALDDAQAARDEIADRLALESEIVATSDAFAALVDLRTLLVEYVDVEFQDLPQIRTVSVPVLGSSVVLAWDLYGDADRDGEINTRNAVQHPLYLSPAVPLSVLSS